MYPRLKEMGNTLALSYSYERKIATRADSSNTLSWCPLLSFFLSRSLSLSLSLLLSLCLCLCFLCSLSFSLFFSLCFLCFLSLSFDSLFDFEAVVGAPFSAWKKNRRSQILKPSSTIIKQDTAWR